jgi:hypothetical protein
MVLKPENQGETLIFRRRVRLPWTFAQGGPFQDVLNLSVYHEQIVAVQDDAIFTSEFGKPGIVARENILKPGFGITSKEFLDFSFSGGEKYQFVGKTTSFDRESAFKDVNPRNNAFAKDVDKNASSGLNPFADKRTGYNLFTNNCQDHAYAVLRHLGVR